MNKRQYRPLPDGLAELAPGPELGAVLALVDRRACNGFQLVEVVRARQRQMCWEQAQLLADMDELAHAPLIVPHGPPRRSQERDARAAKELSFALAMTRRAAEADLAVASQLRRGFAAVQGALAAGRIDLAKAKLMLREVSRLSPDQAIEVIDTVLATVDHRTPAAIRASLRRLIATIDPDLVWRRSSPAAGGRCVYPTEHPDGTASITGRGLPRDAVSAVFDRLNELAAAHRNGRSPDGVGSAEVSGDARTPDEVRADIFLNLLQGPNPARPNPAMGPGATASRRGQGKHPRGQRRHHAAGRKAPQRAGRSGARHHKRPPKARHAATDRS